MPCGVRDACLLVSNMLTSTQNRMRSWYLSRAPSSYSSLLNLTLTQNRTRQVVRSHPDHGPSRGEIPFALPAEFIPRRAPHWQWERQQRPGQLEAAPHRPSRAQKAPFIRIARGRRPAVRSRPVEQSASPLALRLDILVLAARRAHQYGRQHARAIPAATDRAPWKG